VPAVTRPPGGRPGPGPGDDLPDPGRKDLVRPDAGRRAPGPAGADLPELWRQRGADLAGFIRRRLSGDYQVDESGFDPDFHAHVVMPVLRALYRDWFKVVLQGLEHVPGTGAALVVANHSGVLPFDAVMLQAGLKDHHPQHRNLRLLGADLVYQVPGLATLALKAGHTRADPAQASLLLSAGELVGVFPEGFKGTGKPFSQRYQLQRFGRGGFAASAIEAGVPIIPCAIVGAEEIYPMIGNARPLARILRLPYFPVTPLFPWLGPIGAIPLPSNWIIEFSAPVPTDSYTPGDPADINALSAQIRETIQQKLNALVEKRGPAFG
jgi:1-acyl-sn-glycerol-3-phosphate acyltransferase